MTKPYLRAWILAWTVVVSATAHAEDDAAPKPGWEYAPEEFGVGRKHTQNDWCNRKIDVLLDETRRCFNAHPPSACEALQKRNSKKVGSYIKSPRCMRGKRVR